MDNVADCPKWIEGTDHSATQETSAPPLCSSTSAGDEIGRNGEVVTGEEESRTRARRSCADTRRVRLSGAPPLCNSTRTRFSCQSLGLG